MGDLEHATFTSEQLNGAMKEVPVPAPKPKAGAPAVRVDPDRVPTVEDVMNPQRPDLAGASRDDVMASINDLVNKMYGDVFVPELASLKMDLAQLPSPPETPLAAKLLGVIADKLVDAALVYVGGYGAKFAGAAAGELAKSTVDSGAKATAKKAGGWIATKVEEAATPKEPTREMPGESLLSEFIDRTRLGLIRRQHDVINTLRLVRASAAQNQVELSRLDEKLRDLIGLELLNWFRNKVTMEWMNFCARLSLGARDAGQLTDMKHANTIGGFAEDKGEATRVWRGRHEGFVDITISVDHAANLKFVRAFVEAGPGVQKHVIGAAKVDDAHGDKLTLASLPVYRRIWIKTGDSALATNPAFVITPEGAIEANYDDEVLQGIGAGQVQTGDAAMYPFVGYKEYSAEDRANPTARVMRRANANSAMHGARKIVELLATKSPEHIK